MAAHVRTLGVLFGLILAVQSQDCPVKTEPWDRRDCWPWRDDPLTPEKCESRGCVYCPLDPPNDNFPWCFMDDEKCPSEIPPGQRVDCLQEGGNKADCNNKGCIWCRDDEGSAPWCFYDDDVSQGGERCPTGYADVDRIDCWPHEDADAASCVERSCYWCPASYTGAPWCFVPRVRGYTVVSGPNSTPKGESYDLHRKQFYSAFGADIWDLRMDIEHQEDDRLRIKIYDPSNARWEVPEYIDSPPTAASNPMYRVEVEPEDPAFSFRVVRISTGEVLFDTSLGGFVFADQAIQITTRLPTDKLYGFGETEHHSFKHDMEYRAWGQFARDEPVNQNNLYGVYPYYTAFESNNNMHGVLILNSNAHEVKTLPAPGLVFRSTGGILDLYFFMGPSPEQVVQQLTAAVGRPVMVPYWSLGFHLSRYGYNTIGTMQEAINRMRQYDIPHDVQHGDIDTFRDELDFTYDPVDFAGLPEYVQQLKQEGTRWITILDPFISNDEPPGTYDTYDRGTDADAWVKKAGGQGYCTADAWPESCVYADYSKPSCQDWWVHECVLFHDVIEFEGLWIDMNEPAAFSTGTNDGSCADNMWNYPLYKPRAVAGLELNDKTLCMDCEQHIGRHYDAHSLYGWSEGEPSLRAARESTGGKRSIVISRSTYPGVGKYATHWLGDNWSLWSNMHYSIIGMLEFNIFGVPFVGADICGFGHSTTSELCSRWMQLGAFYTFSRNHNGMGHADQDPGQWPEVAARSRDALHVRYRYLPYLYTLFHESHAYGNTVIRPLMHEFPNDVNTHTADTQFLWGSGFLVSPALFEESPTIVNAYFPNARWYDYFDDREEPYKGEYHIMSVPMEIIPIHLRGGVIFPNQEPFNSTVFSRSLPMSLVVAYDENDQATGSLFWDEGDTVDTYENGEYFLARYTATQGSLTVDSEVDGYAPAWDLELDFIKVLGEERHITSVLVNGGTWADFDYNAGTKTLYINSLGLQMAGFSISWS